MDSPSRIVLNGSTGALATRDQGAEFRRRMEEALAGGTIVLEVVLESVGAMTPSFVDECFGKLLVSMGKTEFKKRIKLVSVSEDAKVLVNRVLSDRLYTQRVAEGQGD